VFSYFLLIADIFPFFMRLAHFIAIFTITKTLKHVALKAQALEL
jgi:hypothetical protein